MMGRKSDARRRIIQAASLLFWHQGYEATGVAEILEKAGIGSGSLYWFFKTKEGLLTAVLETYRERLETDIREPAFEQEQDPVERIFRVLDVYRRMLLETEFRLGCPVGNIILELGNRYPKVRQKTEDLFQAWRDMIRGCLVDAADRFPQGTDLGSLSVLVLTIMEGAVMQARSHQDIAYFDESVAGLRDYIRLLTKGAR
jgi:TetR/AcrR family transcriptional repressor of nem operon